ncbi:probable serine/threonine-protein kinase ifkA isoform X1 [Zeugodacus cucurbitae]|uniref:probable serine/threonine-protein kinase ifkA isoform X1 n=2 Tax=Zeugodacus cucurbitae TaxID=28588 RepID=UPI0023D95352|nr:probable serine/threonine-protein kinase ifkA isoform X1 [Zeugodacus cucurbitae]XP_054086341.1 probable serine/threonine-protein kinase ifkA isoform X1 [Zeugodacus cucurbitae]
MSNLLYMDETNCNGIYATKVNGTKTALTTTITTITTTATNNNNNCNENSNNILHASNIIMNSTNNTNDSINGNSNSNSTSNIINNANTNNINNINIMNIAASTVAMTAAVAHANANVSVSASGNGTGTGLTSATLPTSVSNEDLSQSLSEYTDADESISAPTEFLAEFLSAVMLKDYKKALKYCKLILQYEPNNATAKEFYPLIIEKLRDAAASDSDENYNKSSSPEPVLELQSSDPSAGESDEAAFEDQPIGIIDDGDDYGLADDNCHSLDGSHSHELNVSSRSGSSDSAGGSLSESVDDDVEGEDVDDEDIVGIDDDDIEDDDEDDHDDDDDDVEDVISSSGDDLPIDDPNSIEAAAGNNSVSSRNSSSGGGGSGRSRSDNTTHSYSSLLLEEEDDIAPVNLKFTKELSSPDLDVSNGNKLPSTSCSDSESPTEPLTQRLAAILRSKCGVSSAGDNY